MSPLAVALLLIVAAAAILVVSGTLARNRWGLNLGRVLCPRCLRPIPAGSLSQLLFGGRQCPECDTIVDKWGREIMPTRKDRMKAQESARR